MVAVLAGHFLDPIGIVASSSSKPMISARPAAPMQSALDAELANGTATPYGDMQSVPENPKYSYAIVNKQRVIVEPSSRKVNQVIN
jgi:hypothetical protein